MTAEIKISRPAALLSGLVLVLALVLPARSQQVVQRIEAIVNDQVISALDVQERLGLIIAATGGVQNEQELEALRNQVIRNMVDEKLQLQEAAEFEVEIPEGDIQDAYSRVVQSFNQTPEQFERYLARFGSSPRTLMHQLRAEFAWQTLVRGRLGSQVTISDEEVEQTLARMQENAGKFEYRISEIYLIVDNPARAEQARQLAGSLVQQARQDAQFQALARQFSQASSAARGGDLGWVPEGQMAEELDTALKELDVGQVSDPIRTPGGFYIMRVEDRRRILSADPLDAEVNLRQIYYQFTEETTQEGVEQWAAQAEQAVQRINSCEDIAPVTADLAPARMQDIGNVSLRDLGPELRQRLVNLEIGEPSPMIATQDGLRIFVICGRNDPEVSPPTEDEIYQQLESQRLAMMARRYLRDLRRDAIIDYR